MSDPNTVTLYRLFLGDQDSTTGHYRKGFTIHSVSVIVFPAGETVILGNLGYHTVYTETGFTEYDLLEGDVILDGLGRYYEVKAYKDWCSQGEVSFRECQLERLVNFPFLAGFFGFEDEEYGLIGFGFEDGFERGYWAL